MRQKHKDSLPLFAILINFKVENWIFYILDSNMYSRVWRLAFIHLSDFISNRNEFSSFVLNLHPSIVLHSYPSWGHQGCWCLSSAVVDLTLVAIMSIDMLKYNQDLIKKTTPRFPP